MNPKIQYSSNHRLPVKPVFFGLAVILILISSACNLPIVSPTPTTTPPTELPATPVAAAKPLPAAVVETDPLPNSDLSVDGALTVYFNQPMQRASVEGALRTEPVMAGKFEWPDPSTMRFIPDQALPPDTPITLTIEDSATAANGLAMSSPVSYEFQTAPYLTVTERLPRPESTDIDPTSAVVATFNLPVVALGETSAAPDAFIIDPPVEGRGEWLNTSTYIFYPDPAMQGGVKYTITLAPDLKSQSGSPWSSDASLNWSFTTALPQLVNLEPASGTELGLDTPITLTFNQPVDRASVEANLKFTPQGGDPIPGSLKWSEDATQVTYTPAEMLARDTLYTLALSTQATGLGGTALSKPLAANFHTVPALSVVGTDPGQGKTIKSYGGYGGLVLTFSSPLSTKQDFTELVQFSPEINDVSYYATEKTLNIYGYFKPSSDYVLTLSGELADQWGMALGADFTLNFNTKESQPVLNIPMVESTGSRVLFLTSDDSLLPANATNLTSLNIRSGELTLEDFISGTQNYDTYPPKPNRWQQAVNLEANRNQTIGVELTPEGQPLKPGLYAFSVGSSQLFSYDHDINFYIVSSHIQMTLKVSIDEMLIWAVDLETNQPVSGLDVRVLDQNQTEVGSSTTDPNGLATVPLSSDRNVYDYLYVVSGQPGDANFSLAVTNWYAGINAWDYGISSLIQPSKPGVYLYTDRPIYRPGQTVYLRGIVRTPVNGRYELAPEKEYTASMVGPFDPLTGESATLDTQNKSLTAFGTFSMTFTLPENATPGQYHFEVPGTDTYLFFLVANYRKPEMEVKVDFDSNQAVNGSDLHAVIDAQYYFGAPAGNLPVTWSLSRQRSDFYIPGGYQVGPVDTNWLNPYFYFTYSGPQILLTGEATTDTSGKVELTFTPDQLSTLNQTELQDLTLEATITDPSNQPVSGRGSMRLLPADFAIGVQPEVWSSQAGDELAFSVLTVDWNQKVSPNHPLKANFQKITWKQSFSADAGEMANTPEFTSVGSTDFTTGADGLARIAFTPQDPGIYQVTVSNANAVTQVWVWVSGAGSAPWPMLANQRLRLSADAQSYQPGQSARIFIPNPFAGEALALVSVERAKVMRTEVVHLTGSGLDYQLPLSEEDAPNVYVSVTILGSAGGRSDFRQGFIELKVDPAAQILNVKLTGEPARARPGEPLTLTLEVRDAAGQPVQGEFSLALVDKAVLALADPNSASIIEAYYGDQYLGVSTSLSLAAYGLRSIAIPPGRGGGGGDGMVAAPTVREDFQDTAYWNGEVVTDADGRAQINLTLPDNVTTWVGMVRGITRDSLVGETELEIIATRDLLVRPATPRFLVAGDHLELAAVVNNNTTQDLDVQVSLKPTGFTLDDSAQALQTVQIQAGGQQRVTWWGTVESVAEADLVFGAQGGGLEDFARPSWGKLPVLTFSAPQTFGTAGMLSEAGQRIETVSLPRSFTATSGELQVELSPSLAAVVLSDLTVIEQSRYDFTEAMVSRLVPNLETYRALKELGISNIELENQLNAQIKTDLPKLIARQKSDGGWGWDSTAGSDPQISIYAVWALTRAREAGFEVANQPFNNGVQYLLASLIAPQMSSEDYQLDRLAFQYFVLAEAGQTALEPQSLLALRSRLNPWAKAMLALTLEKLEPGNADTTTLLSDLQATALRSASGVNWQDAVEYRQNFVTRNLSTAIVTYALARLDPASPLLVDATRYLITNREEIGGWSTSYESAWVITALIETMKGTGDLQANFTFTAALNGSPLASGEAGGATALNPVRANVPIGQLLPKDPNELVISRQGGNGRLYYRAYLKIDRLAQDAKPIERGMALERRYYQVDETCKLPDCPEITTARLDAKAPIWVRLSLTVPSDQYYAVVEDWLPAGTEVLDLSLKTSQLALTDQVAGSQYNPRNPFAQGWGWWYFGDPQISDDSVTWVAPYLPAGTYELTYQLVPTTAGEFQVLPAHAFIYYFPEVEATSAGNLLTIE
ncbi:large extracellular alpha-helical protein [Longilinea arvoryzae]|uniref:Large extracellular alpha-helical protein n=1 Tax=Longilinea arvoryzae TaxID=360412 RepID=A0A0S7BJW5_9CHLR|nr:Ig-like domain-containing protein [Longilinea arvoryzae]GAP15444.1 large extracellular alpha-helical protein [Longilinea arvoryzae]